MWAGFAALGRSRLNCRKHNWTAPVELTAVQPSPWLYREPLSEKTQKQNRARRTLPNTATLPDVALPPPRMVLFGALAQVLLVPPSGYRCFRRPGCLASVRGLFVAHCLPSSLCLMATKAFGPVWGSFPLHHASCVVGVLCAPSLRYSSLYDPWPLFGLR